MAWNAKVLFITDDTALLSSTFRLQPAAYLTVGMQWKKPAQFRRAMPLELTKVG